VPPLEIEDVDGGVRAIILDRPPANAIEDTLLDALEAAVAEVLRDDTVRAVVLAAKGAFFCGGFDLRVPRRDDEDVREIVASYRRSHRALLALPKPTVALVEGHAIAGGLVLALACEHRVFAAGDYKIGLNEVAIGAAFPAAALEIVRLRTTAAAAAELVLGAEILPVSEAVRLGLVSRLTPADQARDRAFELAARLASFPREVYAHAKAELTGDGLARIDAVSIDDELATAALWNTPASRTARRAQRNRL
jgi:enoyl-CoA hydratase/carnithine racemase